MRKNWADFNHHDKDFKNQHLEKVNLNLSSKTFLMCVNLLHFLSVEKSGKRVREKTVGFWEKRVGGSAAAAVYRS